MPYRPGTNVALLDTPGTVSVQSDTGTWFITGLTDRGSATVPGLITSLNDFITQYGARVSYSSLYDSVETFFKEGGNRAYVGRVVGPGATIGFKNLLDAGAGISLVVSALGPGAWSNQYKVAVVAGTGANFKIQITDLAGNVLEDSGDLADQNAAINWSQYSQYVRITLGATALLPVVMAATVLSTGNDDQGSITDAQWATALALFVPDLGPGQVSAPGRSTDVGHTQLDAHAVANNRVAIKDGPNTATVATLQTSVAATRSRPTAMFAPWDVIPGIVASAPRTVPPSARIAGLIARNDPVFGTNRPSAGDVGVALFVNDLSQPAWTDAQRQTLNASGINVSRRKDGVIKVYGWRTTVDANADPNWVNFANSRLYMQLSAELQAVAENFMFDEIDGQNGTTITAFHDALAGVCLTHFNNQELFGDTAEQAFIVDTGPGVNTLATIAALELHADVRVKMAPFAEYVAIRVVKRQVSDAL